MRLLFLLFLLLLLFNVFKDVVNKTSIGAWTSFSEQQGRILNSNSLLFLIFLNDN